MNEFSANALDPDENKRFIQTAVTPRPIAWISTVDERGNENLAPFSSYNYVGSSQPVVVFNSLLELGAVGKASFVVSEVGQKQALVIVVGLFGTFVFLFFHSRHSNDHYVVIYFCCRYDSLYNLGTFMFGLRADPESQDINDPIHHL